MFVVPECDKKTHFIELRAVILFLSRTVSSYFKNIFTPAKSRVLASLCFVRILNISKSLIFKLYDHKRACQYVRKKLTITDPP